MEKLLRILFVMCAIAFVTTLTACADKKCAACADKKCATTGGDDKPAKTGGNDKTTKNPSILKFTAEANGVTIDTTKDVYKITINPSLLTYAVPWGTGFEASAFMPIFTVTFTDDKKGFIIPTTADKAEDLTTTHASDQETALDTNFLAEAPNNVTHSFLADPDANNPVFGFDATELNADWSTLAPRAAVGSSPMFKGVTDIMTDTKVRVACSTTITGINKDSFKTKTPDPADDLPIAIGTETECFFSLVGGNDADAADADAAKTDAYKKWDEADAAADAAAAADAYKKWDEAVAAADAAAAVQKAAYKTWAKAAVELAKDDATKNIQKMGFVGIVTGDDTASAITTAAGITEDADALGVKGFTADASAKLVKAYKISFQKVEIVIAVAK